MVIIALISIMFTNTLLILVPLYVMLIEQPKALHQVYITQLLVISKYDDTKVKVVPLK